MPRDPIWAEYTEAQARHRRAWKMLWAAPDHEAREFAIAAMASTFKIVRAYEGMLTHAGV